MACHVANSDLAVEQARAQYDDSLATLRAALASFPAIRSKLGAQERHLDDIEGRVAELQRGIRDFAAQVSRRPAERTSSQESMTWKEECSPKARSALADTSPKAASRPRAVSWSKENHVKHYDLVLSDVHVPDHGHWLPADFVQAPHELASPQHADDFVKRVNGRVVIFDGDPDDKYELCSCLLVEPQGKALKPAEYVSTGLVIWLPGLESAEEMEDEWSAVLKESKWLDAGLSVAWPDLQPGSGLERGHLEGAVASLLARVGVEHCVLVGKAWGAQLAVEVVAAGRVANAVAGVVLIAPGEVIEEARGALAVPAVVLWAQDDEVNSCDDARQWARAMRPWRAPTATKEVKTGGHDVGRMVKEEKVVAQVLLHFASATLAMVGLAAFANQLDAQHASHLDAASESATLLPERLERLCNELPEYIAGILGGSENDLKEEGAVSLVLARQLQGSNPGRAIRKLVSTLRDWLGSGMQQVASATE